MMNKMGDKPSMSMALNLARKNKGGYNGKKEERQENQAGEMMKQDKPTMMQEMHGKMKEMIAMMENMMNMEE